MTVSNTLYMHFNIIMTCLTIIKSDPSKFILMSFLCWKMVIPLKKFHRNWDLENILLRIYAFSLIFPEKKTLKVIHQSLLLITIAINLFYQHFLCNMAS